MDVITHEEYGKEGRSKILSPIEQLLKLGPFPDENTVTQEEIDAYHTLLNTFVPPISDVDAVSLVALFGEDDTFYGLAWTMLHLIESAPGWPILSSLKDESKYWITFLRKRIVNKYGSDYFQNARKNSE